MYQALARSILPLLALTASVAAAPRDDDANPAPDRKAMIPMRDGVRLATDIYLPSPDARDVPVLLVRTPYGRVRYNREFGRMRSTGYAIAIQDTRGRFDSEGKAMGFQDDGWGERRDGYDTVEWLARQDFANGKVGTLGASAMGITQYLMAPAAPPSLFCQYVLVAAPSLYHHSTYPGGVFRKKQVEDWLRGHAHPDALGIARAHPFYDAHWRGLDAIRKARDVRVPALHYGGWYDTFCEGTIAGFVAWQTRGGDGARGRQKLVIGPWTHGGPGKRELGEFELPVAARSVPFDISAKSWFDHHLKGADNGAGKLPAVMYYVMGPFDGSSSTAGNVWRSASAWPPVSTTTRTLYLGDDGALTAERPSKASSRTFRSDPAKPVPTTGGRNLYLPPGPRDQRKIEARDDVLVFTSKALAGDLEVTGTIRAHLAMATDGPDADVVVRVCDVYSDGRSILVVDGARRLMAITGKPVEPGKVIDVEVVAGTTSIVFAKGHRVRVSIAGSNFPRYEVNSGSGRVQVNTITIGPSRIALPVVE